MQMDRANPESVAVGDRALAISLDQLEHTLAATVPGREQQWAEAVGVAIDAVEKALRRHKAAARDPNGPLAEVDETRPTLSRQADEIRDGHGDLLQDLLSLRTEVFRAAAAFGPHGAADAGKERGVVVDFGDIRQQAEKILTRLRQTGQAETKLVQDSLNIDIGVGD